MRTRGASEGLRCLRSTLGELPARSRAILVVAALAMVAFTVTSGPSGPELSLTGGNGGPLSIQNSEDGSLLTVGGMAPGDAETVTITNTGSRPGNFTLSSTELEDLPGMGGGRLSDRLQLSVAAPGAPGAGDEIVFSGPLGAMERIDLGQFAPGDARAFRLSVSFPNGGTPSSPLTGDNVYQGAQASVGYRWDAVASSSSGDEPDGSEAAGGSGSGRDGRDGSGGGSRRSAPDGVAPVAAPPLAEPPPPTVITARGRQRLTARGVRVAMSCGGACARVSVVGVVRLPGGVRTLRTRSVSVVPRSPAAVNVRLGFTPRAELSLRRRLARGGHPVIVVRAVGVSSSGQRTNVEKRVLLLP